MLWKGLQPHEDGNAVPVLDDLMAAYRMLLPFGAAGKVSWIPLLEPSGPSGPEGASQWFPNGSLVSCGMGKVSPSGHNVTDAFSLWRWPSLDASA